MSHFIININFCLHFYSFYILHLLLFLYCLRSHRSKQSLLLQFLGYYIVFSYIVYIII
ncbi:hypothetical protein J3Q64DRAFT_1710929 [Phycomyces blakesleeanus]|uniref:Uncharacterized protein n=1 Tax=Phycomyces blakesleeanus TaxID=4837 RepID=A0ABR3BDS8_PHYBL